MALAQFRQIDVFEFFYAGDNLDREQWDPRSLSSPCFFSAFASAIHSFRQVRNLLSSEKMNCISLLA